ncbi:phosphoribosylaminoimidazole carboxylase [Corynebacterium phocae]|uniref:N5-carboxyaminoimidazole ribonucleotide synthase n=2 Tax=Corynebacterium phocae TaxID=161895 RepID=A0A1L7D5B4_9CORY|nr:phosphoribosylaminoimidazole carboxylase [Corynebacterium phocae]KAA8722257.1 5-(carboxyamino)imidazole ribonucleotide synthase [Corynebacterium phocae]
MMQPAAVELGIKLRVLTSEQASSAAQVIPDIVVGDYQKTADCLTAAQGADAVTFDHEHVPPQALQALLAEGYAVEPHPEALIYAQDKLAQRRLLVQLGAPVPEFAAIGSVQDALDFSEEVGGQVCLKTCRGGYDGKGVWFPESREELTETVEKLLAADVKLMAERKVKLHRELSVLVARNPSGEIKVWPVTMSVQENGVCAEAIAPAPDLDSYLERHTRQLGKDIADDLGVTGVLAVELFTYLVDGRETIAVNELAMRPHNTGHWTQDGCVTSQFEQHLRAVVDFPLGETTALAPVTVMANVLGAEKDPSMPIAQRVMEVSRRFPGAKIHLYGKDHRAGRKIGHVNLTGADVEHVRRDARLAADFLVHARWLDEK